MYTHIQGGGVITVHHYNFQETNLVWLFPRRQIQVLVSWNSGIGSDDVTGNDSSGGKEMISTGDGSDMVVSGGDAQVCAQ